MKKHAAQVKSAIKPQVDIEQRRERRSVSQRSNSGSAKGDPWLNLSKVTRGGEENES